MSPTDPTKQPAPPGVRDTVARETGAPDAPARDTDPRLTRPAPPGVRDSDRATPTRSDSDCADSDPASPPLERATAPALPGVRDSRARDTRTRATPAGFDPDRADHPASDLPFLPAPWRGRLVVLAGIVLVALNARIMVAVVSPIISYITTDLPLTSTHEALIGLAAPLCFALFGVVSPPLGRRYGLEAMMVAALISSTAGELLRALAATPTGFIIWTIPALAGAGIGNVIVPPLIKKYFPDRVSAVTAVYSFFLAISTALPPLFILSLTTQMGWRFSVGLWAALGAVALVPWALVVFSRDRAGQRLAAVKRRLDPRTPIDRLPRLAVPLWRSPLAWGMALVFGGNSLLSYTMFTWLPHVLRDDGVTPDRAALYLAVFTAASLPGSFLTPLIVARVKRKSILPVIFFLSYAVSYTALAIRPAYGTMAWILLSRIGDCFFAYVITMINLRTTSTRGSIALSGFVQAAGYTIAIVGPWGFGALHTLSGTWHVPMFALVAVLPVMLVGGLITARAKPLQA